MEEIELLHFDWVDKNSYPSDVFIYAADLTHGCFEHIQPIETMLEQYITRFQITRLQAIDRAILTISIYSILYEPSIPLTAIINEAIRISKRFSEDHAYKLINKILEEISINEVPPERKQL